MKEISQRLNSEKRTLFDDLQQLSNDYCEIKKENMSLSECFSINQAHWVA